MSKKLEYEASTSLSENLGKLCENSETCDVTFVVEDKKIPAHRFVLAFQSEFFKKLLFDNKFKEGELSEIPIEAPVEAFELLISFLYTARLSLEGFEMKSKVAVDLLDLSKRYQIQGLEKTMIKYLMDCSSVKNVFEMLNISFLYESEALREKCVKVMDVSGSDIFKDARISGVNIKTLKEILTSSQVTASIRKFYAFKTWWTHNGSELSEADKEDLANAIDLSRFSNRQIIQIIGPAKLFEDGKLFRIMVDRGAQDVIEEAEKLYSTNVNMIVGEYSYLNRTSYLAAGNFAILEFPGTQLAYCCSFKTKESLGNYCSKLLFSHDLNNWDCLDCPQGNNSQNHYHYDRKPFKYIQIEDRICIRDLKFGLVKGMSHENCLKN